MGAGEGIRGINDNGKIQLKKDTQIQTLYDFRHFLLIILLCFFLPNRRW